MARGSEATNRLIKPKRPNDLAAPRHQKLHDKRLWDLRKKRDRESKAFPNGRSCASLASAIKEHTLTHLADYLEEFERNATANGVARALGKRRRRAQPDRLTTS